MGSGAGRRSPAAVRGSPAAASRAGSKQGDQNDHGHNDYPSFLHSLFLSFVLKFTAHFREK
jgi:hypothetical protein